MKNLKGLFEKFKNMPLGKQSLIAIGTITLIIAVLTNYKDIKNQSKKIIDKLTNDIGVKEFMQDINAVIQNISKLLKDFFKKDDIVAEQESENKEEAHND